MYNTALFDFDGVVMDTETQYTDFWDSMGREYISGLDDFAHLIKGQTLVQVFDRYFGGQLEVQRELEARINAFESAMRYDYIPGIVDFLTDLRKNRVNTAVVTSSNRQKMGNVYKSHPELASYFDLILTSEDFTRSKPAPDCYLTAARRLSVEANQCVVFEDSINGLKAGKAAGMKVCGLATTLSAETISSLSDMVIDDFSGLSYQKFCSMLVS